MRSILALLVASLCASSSWAAPLQNIGVASAVTGAVKAAAPGAVGRVLETGKDVFLNDHVTTNAAGHLQVLLADETTFTLGPNSDMVLDEFVYDPKTSAGKVSASVAKGVFRFVTGKVARRDPDRMNVKVPMGTIGIRGTMVAGKVDPTEATIVLIGPGRSNDADETPGGIRVGNDLGSVDIDRSGYATTLKLGAAPSRPFELRGVQLDAILDGLASAPKGGNRGGVGGKPGETSGEDAARGRYYCSIAEGLQQDQQPELTQYAEQDGGVASDFGGGASWEQIRGGIVSGTGVYSGSTAYSGPTNTISVTLDVNFGAQTLGGGTSNITATGSVAASANINQFSYATAAGLASENLIPHMTATGGVFNTANLQLENAGGVIAKTAVVTAAWATIAGPSTANATINAPR